MNILELFDAVKTINSFGGIEETKKYIRSRPVELPTYILRLKIMVRQLEGKAITSDLLYSNDGDFK
jgi:hypothetical protein